MEEYGRPVQAPMLRSSLNGYVDYVAAQTGAGTTVAGWAWDSGKPNDPVVVEFSRNGRSVATIAADRFRPDLVEAGFGNGCHSFEIELPPAVLTTDARDFAPEFAPALSARIQGSAFELNRSPFRCGSSRPAGSRPAAEPHIERLRADIESFARAWEPGDNQANRLASLSARDGGLTRVDARPQWFMIETTSHCNLKCVICPHGHGAMVNTSELDTTHFSKNIDFLAAADRMQLFGTGEPLMSPAFWEILQSIDPESPTEVSINSNGTLLNRERIERLLGSPLSWISISLDAARPETYRRVRGADFHLVISRVRDLIRERNARRSASSAKDSGSSPKLGIFINMTLMRENIEEFPEFVDLAADLGADGVQVCQLLWHNEHRTWQTQKGDWSFVYRDQLLKNLPEKANHFIRQAVERGVKRNVPIVFDWSQFEGSRPIVQGGDA
jgi:molybdenum cofactor biosynthesis enzyme MoaA